MRPPLAPLAGLLAAFATALAPARSTPTFSCATGAIDPSPAQSANHRPLPRILQFGVRADTDPLPPPGREQREATVTGGDATRGWLRLDLRFDTAIPDGCRLPLTLTDAGDAGNPSDRLVVERLARVLDGLSVSASGGQDLMDHLRHALAFAGTGSDTASFRVPIRAGEGERTARHALKLVLRSPSPEALPFTVNVAPLPPFGLVAPETTLRPGTPVLLRAQHPSALLPGTAAMPVLFRLSSTALGRWQPALPATPGETRSVWDARFTPLRAEAALVPASATQVASGQVTVVWAGRTQTLPVSIPATAAAAAGCSPAFAVAAFPGGLRLNLSNRAGGTCPVHLATTRPPALAVLQPSPSSAPLRAAPAGVQRLGSPVSGLSGVPAALPVLGAARDDGGVLFAIPRAAFGQLKAGTRFEWDIEAEDDTRSKHRVGITLTAADVATIVGKAAP